MSLFDFFFPEQAQAAHLRRLADTSTLTRTKQRVAHARTEKTKLSSEKRVVELEDEVAQLTIILEAVLEVLSDDGSITRSDLAKKVAEIDARDGTIDGRITQPEESDKSAGKPKFNFPE